jgi:hypothetical protein
MFTAEEKRVLRSMEMYWQEVRQRDDKSPLRNEVHQVISVIGPSRLLRCVEIALDCDE